MELDRNIEIAAAARSSRNWVDWFSRMRERLELAVDEWNEMQPTLERKVDERTQQLQTAQRKLLQADRLASLGQRADW
jgi:C4-dicarboxylate-specific signal transduction histidine kinase